MPVASKSTKAATTASQQRAIFKTFGFGVSTNRDEWVYDDSADALARKVKFLISGYASSMQRGVLDPAVKWSRNLKRRLEQRREEKFDPNRIIAAAYRPYYKTYLYDSSLLIDELGVRESLPSLEGHKLGHIVMTDPTAQNPWLACVGQALQDALGLLAGGAGLGVGCVGALQRPGLNGFVADVQFHQLLAPGRPLLEVFGAAAVERDAREFALEVLRVLLAVQRVV